MTTRPALVTGFAPYAGRGVNPAAEIAKALDGKIIAGTPVRRKAPAGVFRRDRRPGGGAAS